MMIMPLWGLAQDSLNFEQRMGLIESQIDTSNLASAWSRNLPVSVYFRSSFLRIADELNEQVAVLSSFEAGLDGDNPYSPRNKRILEFIAVSEGQIKARLTELNLLAEICKLGGNKLSSPFSLVSDWQLKDYHHRLLKTYALNNGFANEAALPVRNYYESFLAQLETELISRQILPTINLKRSPGLEEKLTQRLTMVEELNRLARQEAYLLVDYSPLLIDNRASIAQKVREIRHLDRKMGIPEKKLPVALELLDEYTMKSRLETMEHGARQLKIKNNLTRHYAIYSEIHLAVVEESIEKEKKWLYTQKRQAVVANGISARGPPDTEPPLYFTDDIFPKSPGSGPGSLTLQTFLDDAGKEKISIAGQKAYEKTIRQMRERFQAYNLNLPNWHDVKSVRYRPPNFDSEVNKVESYLKRFSANYFLTLPSDPAEAALNRAAFETAIEKLATGAGIEPQKVKIADFIVNDRALSIAAEEGLVNGIQAWEKALAEGKGVYHPWLQGELENMKAQLESLRKAMPESETRLPIDEPWKKKGGFDRPPPLVEELCRMNIARFEEITTNEAFVKTIYEAQEQALKKIGATYGIHAPASIGARLNHINSLKTTNQVANKLQTFREYAKYVNYIKALDSYKGGSEYSNDFARTVNAIFDSGFDYEGIKAKESSLRADFDGLSKNLSRNKTKLPDRIRGDIENAREVLPKSKNKGISPDIELWRPNQDLEKLKSMTQAKDPGGIWLSPEGLVFNKIKMPELEWKILPKEASCYYEPLDEISYEENPYYSEEWLLNDHEKICFLKSKIQIPLHHWLKQYGSWLHEQYN